MMNFSFDHNNPDRILASYKCQLFMLIFIIPHLSDANYLQWSLTTTCAWFHISVQTFGDKVHRRE